MHKMLLSAVLLVPASALAYNGCSSADYEDLTGQQGILVTSAQLQYTPKCARIAVDAMVTFNDSFNSHPLSPGHVVAGVAIPDADSPIVPTTTGTSAMFSFPQQGVFGYYCDYHAANGQIGVIQVGYEIIFDAAFE
jgi:plastocyanin